MGKISLKKLFTGLGLIFLAFFILLVSFYVTKVKPELAFRKSVKNKKLSAQVAKVQERVQAIKDEQREVQPPGMISLKNIVKESESLYGQSEKNRKEGYLWIDQKSSQYVVTLGAVNGLKPGSRLSVYDGDTKIGQVMVDTPFDVISYVQPVNNLQSSLTSDYYRVVIE